MSYNQENKRAVLLFLSLAVLSSLMFYQVNKPYRIDGKYAAPNMDTFLYMQYARAFSDGHPYQFNRGDPATTGCTSHLYPVILGLFHWIGIHDFGLLEVAFWLNVLFFLASVVMLWGILIQLEPKGRWFVTTLFTLSGYTVMIYTGLSDMGLFVVLTFALFFSMIHERYLWTGIILFLLPFTRPEGMIITAAYLILLLLEHRNTGTLHKARSKYLVLGAGLLACAGVFILNGLLTGMMSFDSTADKGYFGHMHLLTALNYTLRDVLTLWKGLLFGMESSFRKYFLIPLISGMLILFGFFYQSGKKNNGSPQKSAETLWLISIIFSLAMIAASGFLGIHHDRYMLWMMPLLLIYLIRGIFALPLKRNVQIGLCIVFMIFQLASYPYFLSTYILNSGKTQPRIEAVRKAKAIPPPETSIAVSGGSGIKYLNPEWVVINLGGVTAPWFRQCEANLAMKIKTCQHSPQLRFKTFMRYPENDLPVRIMTTDSQVVDIPSLFRAPMTFYNVDWQSLIIGDVPLTDTLMKRLPPDLKSMDHFDAAWPEDERRVHLKIYHRYAYSKQMPVLTSGKIGGKTLVDAARPVIGGAFFTLNTEPGNNHWFVFRFALNEDVIFNDLEGVRSQRISTQSVQFLNLKIWNRYDAKIDMTNLSEREDEHFVERIVRIPGRVITSGLTQFGLIGDHLLCDVWLFSEKN
ncbi:hypothetical protein JW835_00055 [bacterium]|nr:hypothetical protein [bacterium]